ncbi:VOC family protein [Kribbella sp. CA-247076]|uniref:VOC family protein n=1 Tax=Kribbella sp. CA-247076 TaxID=3239941 RepID=UPI003D8F53E7
MMRGFATVSFYAADLNAARDWYTTVLGLEPYYAFPTKEAPAYLEWRFGDYECELGIIDAQYATHPVGSPAGAVMQWHVDDLEGELDHLLAHGATLIEPITERGGGDSGFRTALVADPFGNLIGIMNNPHYLEILAKLKH